MKKSILVMYTAVGRGHKIMAENIAAALGTEYQVDMLDLFEFQQSKLIDRGTAVYLWILDKIPWLWEFFYSSKIVLGITMPFRTILAGLKSAKIRKVLESKDYDIVISTQVNPSSIISYLKAKGLFKGKFIVSFSDYHLQIFWLFRNVDLYLVNTAEVKDQMIALGYDSAKIFVIGMALPQLPQLSTEQIQQLRQKYTLAAGEKGVLVMGGTMGYKLSPKLIEGLLATKAKIFIVCGNNTRAKTEMERYFAANPSVQTFGHVNFMPELYAISNLVVSKPGGLTVAECIQRALPLAIYAYLPGQEKMNTNYLRAKNLVLPETDDFVKQVADELHTGAFAAQLRQNIAAKVITQDSSTVRRAISQL